MAKRKAKHFGWFDEQKDEQRLKFSRQFAALAAAVKPRPGALNNTVRSPQDAKHSQSSKKND
jgi:hypothetical protein